MKKKKVETIDLTPTWQTALQIYLTVLESGTDEGKRLAKEGLNKMANVAQAHVELLKKTK